MRTRLGIAFLLVSVGAACAKPRPVQDPLDYLVAGVDPEIEAERVALHLGRAGYAVDRRVEGAGAVALGARRLRDGATAVRLVTRRGMVLGVDAPDDRHPERRAVRLPEGAGFTRREMDGLFELPIEVLGRVRCVAVVLLDSGGFVRELTQDENPYPNEGCYPDEEDGEASEDELDVPALEEGDEIIDGGSPGSAGAPAEG